MKFNKTFWIIVICAISMLSIIFSSCASKNMATNKLTSTSLEDYVIIDKTIGNIHYQVADYEPMAKWFTKKARGLNDDEIVALYETLPLIGDVDNFDYLPAEEKKQYILQLSKTIINKDPGYIATHSNYSRYSEEAMNEVFEYFTPLFTDKKLKVLLVLNPFFCNGGMGVYPYLEDGQTIGRLEIGSARMAFNPVSNKTLVRIWIAHEFTHLIYQYSGDYEMMDEIANSPEIAENGGVYTLGLFMEGLAVYSSSLITGLDWNNPVNYSDLMFYDEYSDGPVLENGFIQKLAEKLTDSISEKEQFDYKLYAKWFSSRTPKEDRPFPPYPALGYFLGAHIIRILVEDEGMSLMEIFNKSLPPMMTDVNRVLHLIAES